MAELLDDVVGEVMEYIQGHNHLVIVEGFRRSLAEKKDSLEHVNGGLAVPCLEESSFLFRVISIVTVIFVFVLDGRFVRVNTSLVLVLLFPGLQTDREASASLAGSEGVSYMVSLPRAPVVLPLPGVKSGQVEQCKLSVGHAMVVAGQWSVPAVARRSSQHGSGKLN
jgi:hypothetical protein